MAYATARGVMVLIVVAVVVGGAAAQPQAAAPAPGPAGEDCFNAMLNISDCLTFVENGSNLTKPDKGCCPEVAGLVESHPDCLCKVLHNASSVGFQFDLSRAFKMPAACNLTTPSFSLCSAFGYPVQAPIGYPVQAPMAPGGSASATGGAGPLAPASGNNNSGAPAIAASTLPLFTGLALLALLPTLF